MSHTWESLNAMSVARQFPEADLPVAELAGRIGPMQTQTARSAFLGLAARSTQATHGSVTAAYEAGDLVRGSALRGTVHTAVPPTQRVLDVATRLMMLRYWQRHLGLETTDGLVELWSAIEEHAAQWRTPAQLRDFLAIELEQRFGAPTRSRLDDLPSHHLAVSHGGLVRRPLKGEWSGQGAPVYAAACSVTGLPLPPEEQALPDLVRLHLRAHGPASRHDLAWWSGLTLTLLDSVVAGLGDEVVTEPGPDGRDYLDLRDVPAPRTLDDVRLLPEFDAVLCAYDPKARSRFVTPEHHQVLWNSANGLLSPPLLVDGRVAGYWRAAGSARRRPLEVTVLRGMRRPRSGELAEAVSRLESALDITVTEVSVARR